LNRESANVDFSATEERFWCGPEAVLEVTERPGQLGLQVQTIFRQY
jgi:hypothetical protein